MRRIFWGMDIVLYPPYGTQAKGKTRRKMRKIDVCICKGVVTLQSIGTRTKIIKPAVYLGTFIQLLINKIEVWTKVTSSKIPAAMYRECKFGFYSLQLCAGQWDTAAQQSCFHQGGRFNASKLFPLWFDFPLKKDKIWLIRAPMCTGFSFFVQAFYT